MDETDVNRGMERTRELDRLTRDLRALSFRTFLSEQRQRRRIALETHENIAQRLIFCSLRLNLLLKQKPSSETSRQIGELQQIIQQLIKEVRLLTLELSPPILYDLGLEAAIHELLREVRHKCHVLTTFEESGPLINPDESLRILLFQSVQELINNIVQHANAETVLVMLERKENCIKIVIEDDGIGIHETCVEGKSQRGIGLLNINERMRYIGGYFEVQSKLDHGTQITIVAPLKYEQ